MTRAKLGAVLGGTVAIVAMLVGLTVLPIGGMGWRTQPVTATAVGAIDDFECVNIDFAAEATYRVDYPLLDVWGLWRVSETSLDHATLTATATGYCAEKVAMLGADADVVAPVCDGDGLCEGAFASYMFSAQPGPVATVTFEYPQPLPASGLIRGDWCLTFYSGFEYSFGGTGGATGARFTEGDLCLDRS